MLVQDFILLCILKSDLISNVRESYDVTHRALGLKDVELQAAAVACLFGFREVLQKYDVNLYLLIIYCRVYNSECPVQDRRS